MTYVLILLGMVVYFLPIYFVASRFYKGWAEEAAGQLDDDDEPIAAWKETLLKVGIVIWVFLLPSVLLYLRDHYK